MKSILFLIDFSYFSISKIIDFRGTVVIFEFFAISTRDVSFVLFLCHFGPHFVAGLYHAGAF